MPKSRQKIFPFPDIFEHPKSECFNLDYGCSTSLDLFTYRNFLYKTVQLFAPIVVVWISDVLKCPKSKCFSSDFRQPNAWEWDRSEVSENQTCSDFKL